MSISPVGRPEDVAVIPDDETLVPLDEWLDLVAYDEEATLPKPAARYLEEIREFGEV